MPDDNTFALREKVGKKPANPRRPVVSLALAQIPQRKPFKLSKHVEAPARDDLAISFKQIIKGFRLPPIWVMFTSSFVSTSFSSSH